MITSAPLEWIWVQYHNEKCSGRLWGFSEGDNWYCDEITGMHPCSYAKLSIPNIYLSKEEKDDRIRAYQNIPNGEGTVVNPASTWGGELSRLTQEAKTEKSDYKKILAAIQYLRLEVANGTPKEHILKQLASVENQLYTNINT